MCVQVRKRNPMVMMVMYFFSWLTVLFFFCRIIWNLQFRCESATLVYLLVVDCSLLVVVKETVFLPDPIILFLKWITYSDQIKPCWNNCRSPPFFFFLSPIHTFFVLILPSSTQKTENYKETPNLIKAYSTQTFQHFLFW